MSQEHYTIEEYSALLAGETEPEKEETMQEHLESCPLCNVKMRAATLLTLLEDDEVLEMAMQLIMDANKDKDSDADADEDADEDADLD